MNINELTTLITKIVRAEISKEVGNIRESMSAQLPNIISETVGAVFLGISKASGVNPAQDVDNAIDQRIGPSKSSTRASSSNISTIFEVMGKTIADVQENEKPQPVNFMDRLTTQNYSNKLKVMDDAAKKFRG